MTTDENRPSKTQRVLEQLFRPHLESHPELGKLSWTATEGINGAGVCFKTEHLDIDFYVYANTVYVQSNLPDSFIIPGKVNLTPEINTEQLKTALNSASKARQDFIKDQKG